MGHVQDRTHYLTNASNSVGESELDGGERVRTGIPIFLNMAIPFLVSMIATSWGVETITAPGSVRAISSFILVK